MGVWGKAWNIGVEKSESNERFVRVLAAHLLVTQPTLKFNEIACDCL